MGNVSSLNEMVYWRYFVGKLYDAKSRDDFFRILCEYIPSFVRKDPLFENFLLYYTYKKNEHEQKRLSLLEAAWSDLNIAFNLIKSGNVKFEEADLLSDKISVIESSFKIKDIYSAYSLLTCFSVVRDMNFSSLQKLKELDSVWSYLNPNKVKPWVAFEYLILSEWCWKRGAAFFERKHFSGVDLKDFEEISLHEYWLEMKGVKDGNEPSFGAMFFTKELFLKFVEIIELKSIYLYKVDPISECGLSIFQKAELTFNNGKLLLDVQYSNIGSQTRYIVYESRYESVIYKALECLFELDLGKILNLSDISSHLTAPKFYDRVVKNSILKKIFFKDIEENKTYCIALEKKDLNSASLSWDDLKGFSKYIDTLEQNNPTTSFHIIKNELHK